MVKCGQCGYSPAWPKFYDGGRPALCFECYSVAGGQNQGRDGLVVDANLPDPIYFQAARISVLSVQLIESHGEYDKRMADGAVN